MVCRRRLLRWVGAVVPVAVLLAAAPVLAACGSADGKDDRSPVGTTTGPSSASASPSTGPSLTRAASPATPVLSPTGASTNTARAARYAFPVPGPGVGYGRSHHDYPATDIEAPCAAVVVSPVSGTVTEVSRTDRWSSRVNDGSTRGGLSFTVVGVDGVRYYGSHLLRLEAAASIGRHVLAGEPLGRVGQSGDARGVPCHLHFGISPPCRSGDWWVRRGVVYPWPYLDAWRAGGQRSPTAAVTAWRKAHGCPSSPGGMP